MNKKITSRMLIATLLISSSAFAVNAQSNGRSSTQTVAKESLALNVGGGTTIRLPAPMNEVFVTNDNVADVQVRSATELYVYGKVSGQATVSAVDRSGNVIYSATVSVGENISSVSEMLKLTMPDAKISSTVMNGVVILTGTVASPSDIEEAKRNVQSFIGPETRLISRLQTSTPLQVLLKVKISEVNRSVTKDIGLNFTAQNNANGFIFGAEQGQSNNPGIGTAVTLGGNLLGVDILSSLNLAEANGLATTLAEPNLTSLSGETAKFLAGGEFPIPISQGAAAATIEYKPYGVSLAFTPTVHSDGRISLKVRPEVSEISTVNGVRLNGFNVPAISTRRAETTVELGSGQSFMIGGLMSNQGSTLINKAPYLGDVPILGALFRSNSYRKAETELLIVVTPYLVRPSSAKIPLPTDGYKVPTDTEQLLLGRVSSPNSRKEVVKEQNRTAPKRVIIDTNTYERTAPVNDEMKAQHLQAQSQPLPQVTLSKNAAPDGSPVITPTMAPIITKVSAPVPAPKPVVTFVPAPPPVEVSAPKTNIVMMRETGRPAEVKPDPLAVQK